MRWPTAIVLLAFGWPSHPFAQSRSAPVLAPDALVFDRVTVIDVERGARLPHQRVVVRGNRIHAMGSWHTIRIPRGARVVDARNRYLIPGLWDMHVHAATGLSPTIIYPHANAVFLRSMANGVTGIRDAGAQIPLDTFRAWKQEIAAGQRTGPRLIVSGPALDDSVGCPKPDSVRTRRAYFTHHICVFDLDDARHLVDSLRAAGADMIKTYMLSAPIYFAIAAEARRVGMPFGGHLPANLTGLVASDSGARILDHGLKEPVCGYGGDTVMSLPRCTVAADRLRRNNTWIATWWAGAPEEDSLLEALRQRAARYAGPPVSVPSRDKLWTPLTAAERQQRPSGTDFAAVVGNSAYRGRGCQRALLAYATNLPIMPGQDGPGFGALGSGVHRSMLNAVLCGVPPLWALQTATLNPALALRATDSLGTVAIGKVADLVLLEGDPLEDIWNVSKIEAVISNGRYFDRAALDQLLMDVGAASRMMGEIHRREAAKTRRP